MKSKKIPVKKIIPGKITVKNNIQGKIKVKNNFPGKIPVKKICAVFSEFFAVNSGKFTLFFLMLNFVKIVQVSPLYLFKKKIFK